jgi:hypothetical protein
MGSANTFDSLVAELSVGERRELLQRLTAQTPVDASPLFQVEDLPETIELDKRYRESPWYLRFWLRLQSVFQGKPPEVLLRDQLLRKLAAAAESRCPGFFDSRRGLLLNEFFAELNSLKESARFFYDALDGSIARDKGAFFAFLASLEFDFVHQRLTSEADPANYAASNRQASDNDVRQATSRALEAILQTIDEDQRKVMYRNVRSLLCLKELASFLFDRALASFSVGPAGNDASCPLYLLQDQLLILNDILFSMSYPPTLTLLESVFVFDLQERMADADFDMVQETKALLAKASEAVARIRQFNRRVPLTFLLRCATRDLAYLPRSITGGEDWFAVYREFWRKRQDERFAAFVAERRRAQLAEEISLLLKGKPLAPLEYCASELNPNAVPVRPAFALAFLAGFYRHVFIDELNRLFKPILIDGEFYRRENRAEFTEAYNELLKLGDAIRAFDRKLSPNGDIGALYESARREMVAVPVKRRQLSVLIQEAETEAAAIAGSAGRSLRTLAGVLDGLINGASGGKYDTLSNLSALSGHGGAFLSGLRAAAVKVDKAVQLLADIEALETGR